MALELVQLCWLCGTRVSLEDCKIDEHGEAVQEKCYVSKLALSRRSSLPVTTRKALEHASRIAIAERHQVIRLCGVRLG
jgi:hypothetical protein